MTGPFRLSTVAALAMAPSFWVVSTAAQEADRTDLTHWAYAATFGSGVYELGENTEVLVLRAPFSWRWRTADPSTRCNCGLKLLLPVTVGVQNFDLEQLLEDEFPKRLEQVSFLPGVEIELPQSERWTLRVRAQLGWGKELGGGESALIYAAGVRSRWVWPNRSLQPAWISGIQWTGHRVESGERSSLARITNGVELEIAVPRWQFRDEPMHLMPYLLNDWYVDPVSIFGADEAIDDLEAEWEIGVAAGRARPFSVLGITLDRVGLGFRYSEDSRGIRLVFGSIF